MPPVKRFLKVSKGKTGKRCMRPTRAARVKKPQEAQKAKALWKMKAAKDAGEEYCDPMREDNIRQRSNWCAG